MTKPIRMTLLAAAAAILLTLPAYGAPEEETSFAAPSQADVTYSGLLDPRTGLPLEPNRLAPEELAAQLGYDKSKRVFTYPAGEFSFTANIPDGAVLSLFSGGSKVAITLPDGLNGTLYRNGDMVSAPDLSSITEPGSYHLDIRGGNSSQSAAFSFAIVDSLTNSLTEVQLPAGFAFQSPRLNGEALSSEYSNYIELLEDGEYDLSWSCDEIGQSYSLSFTLDTQAPTLELPEVTDGQAHSAVTLNDLEAGAYILLESGGETRTIRSAMDQIKEAGTYHLTVFDQAGNSTQYDFVIHVYLNISALAAIALLALGLGGLFGYSRYIKKHPRVG